MKWILLFALIILFSCKESRQENETTKTRDSIEGGGPAISITIDTTAARIYTQILKIETEELQQFSKISNIGVKILSYDSSSTTDFYIAQKQELEKAFAVSSNKEKTLKAIEYLKSMISKSPSQLLYRVKFKLDAVLVNKTTYNGEYEKYLKEDLSEIKLLFPE